MSVIPKTLAASLLSLSFAWSAAAGGDLPRHDGAYPTCDIRVVHQGASVVFESLVVAPASVSGVYQMQISQGGYAGQSDIRQSGDFSVPQGANGSLGVVSLSRTSGGYVATLTVHWDDGTPDCTRQVGTGRPL